MAVKYARGDVVVLVAPGDFGKPRPAVVVQADIFNENAPSYTVCLFTTELIEAPLIRLTVIPTKQNALKETAQIMTDKIMTVKGERIRQKIGRISELGIRDLDRALRLWLGL